MTATLPVLYSFRRCPYAMRARLALAASRQQVELREVVLKDKPPELLQASAKATVPILVLPDGEVIDESLEIMLWALRRGDPERWLAPQTGSSAEMIALIADNDGDFKHHLDRYKYPQRHDGADAQAHRRDAAAFAARLEGRLGAQPWLFGQHAALADMAIGPFVRQFAGVDPAWFAARPWPQLRRWLAAVTGSARFGQVMGKYPRWRAGDPPTLFPPT